MTAITGVSGSGKSSLAFDTLYAEGQRRFVDCLSTYARQFLPRLDRPDVDFIGEIQPPVALEQKVSIRNARSTVGTITEVADYLALLFAHGGTVHCTVCDAETEETTVDSAVARVRELANDARWLLLAPMSKARVDLAWLQERGFHRFWVDGVVREEPGAARPLHVVVDRFTTRALARARASESLESAWRLGEGEARVVEVGDGEKGARGPALRLVRGLSCVKCGARGEAPRAPHFSANSAIGACERCQGFGRVVTVDRAKVIPDGTRTLRNHAVAPFATATGAEMQEKLLARAEALGIPTGEPFESLSDAHQAWVYGGDKQYPGVDGLFRRLDRKRYKPHVRIFLARYRGYVVCPDCLGARRRSDIRRVRLDGATIDEIERRPIEQLRPWLAALELSPARRAAVASVRAELETRLRFLDDVGLGYLTLGRTARTLSGGETQRIRLASGLGSALTETLYVLDEPTVGLHALDAARMLAVLRALCDHGNTVVVVEHDPGIVERADHLIVLGPSGGERGGEIVFEGAPTDFARREPDYFRCRPQLIRPMPAVGPKTPSLVLHGVKQHNLDLPTLRVPLDRLVVVTGVSGSGKSTLLEDVLYRNALRALGRTADEVGQLDRLAGMEQVEETLLVAQEPIGRSSRSNVVTFVDFLGAIRALLAKSPRAKSLRLGPGHFSFNRPGGRCESCEGMGVTTIEMHFMADVRIVCEACQGRRFQERVLEVRWKGRNIAEMLELTVQEALGFFSELSSTRTLLTPLVDVGLDYLRLGQSTSTLSGGEAQRLQIAAFLSESPKAKRRLYLFDEPTSGLHARDITRLLTSLRRLTAKGHGVVVVEHQLDFIRAADYVIDLGPGGGDRGGRLLFAGPVAGLLTVEESATGRALRASS